LYEFVAEGDKIAINEDVVEDDDITDELEGW